MSTVDVSLTIGAAFAGCVLAVGLSSVLSFQTFLYFHIFPFDSSRYKFLVAWIWFVDSAHTVLICMGVWHYAIANFGNQAATAFIYPGFALNNIMTTSVTFSVNIFYLLRIHKLSRGNWWFTVPIALLCLARLSVSYSTSIEMFRAKTFHTFLAQSKPVLIASLSVSASTELAIAGSRWYFLRCIRAGYSMSHEAVDGVLVFTVNDGIAVILIAAACFLTMPHYWIFTAVFFLIAKMSGNSLLATLNLRNWYRHRHVQPQARTIQMKARGPFSDTQHSPLAPGTHAQFMHKQVSPADSDLPGKVEVFEDHQVELIEEFPRAEHGRYGRDASSNKSDEM
ncbi:hypothetical protein B0H13DRAFT_2304956 [Mycena leptocephala]|nr:hypothetical protein B0H13DRAFT_2304956 [Mycena leptocephala]